MAAWHGDPESLRAETIQSVTRFIELYRQEYDPRRLVTRLHKTDPLTIYREGRAMGVNMAGIRSISTRSSVSTTEAARRRSCP